MSDRQLLEDAAKAARMEFLYVSGAVRVMPGYKPWSPLTDDGDAFRLAVKLDLSVSVFNASGLTIVTATNRPFTELEIQQEHEDNANAATRRAITRAAAAISTGREG